MALRLLRSEKNSSINGTLGCARILVNRFSAASKSLSVQSVDDTPSAGLFAALDVMESMPPRFLLALMLAIFCVSLNAASTSSWICEKPMTVALSEFVHGSSIPSDNVLIGRAMTLSPITRIESVSNLSFPTRMNMRGSEELMPSLIEAISNGTVGGSL